MEILRGPQSVAAPATLPPTSKKDDKETLCDKILSVLKSAFNHFVYFITCCQIDLRTKEVAPTKAKPVQMPSTLEYMKTHHNGRDQKFELSIGHDQVPHYAWYSDANNQALIIVQYKDAFDAHNQKDKLSYRFNSDGYVDLIQYQGEEEKEYNRHNHEHHRMIFRCLDIACKQPKATTIIKPKLAVRLADYNHLMRESLTRVEKHSSKENPIHIFSEVLPEEYNVEAYCTQQSSTPNFSTLHFKGLSLTDKKEMTLTMEINQETGKTGIVALNGVTMNDYCPEFVLWRDVLLHTIRLI